MNTNNRSKFASSLSPLPPFRQLSGRPLPRPRRPAAAAAADQPPPGAGQLPAGHPGAPRGLPGGRAGRAGHADLRRRRAPHPAGGVVGGAHRPGLADRPGDHHQGGRGLAPDPAAGRIALLPGGHGRGGRRRLLVRGQKPQRRGQEQERNAGDRM